MKKYFLLVIGIISSFSLVAQTKAISYQAVIMDPNQIEIPGQSIVGQPLSNGAVCLKFTLLNADGTVDYEETQSTQTDEFGLVSLSIGSAPTNNQIKRTILQTGKYTDFSTIKWDEKRKSLKVSVSFDNCNSYKVSSTETLAYTPYAMYAAGVEYKNVDGAPTSLSQFTNDVGFIVPKDLEPIKKDILQTQNDVTNLSTKTDGKLLVLNQQIAVLDSSNKTNSSKLSAIDTTLASYNTRINNNEASIKQTNTYVNQQVGGLQTQINTTNTTINQLGVTYEVVSNKSNDANLGSGAPSSELYPTQLAVKSYVDQTVQDAVASGAPDATTLAKGKLKLAGDLGGTADAPTVPALALKESLSNKSTSVSTDGNSDSKYPSAKAVKDYVDASVSGVAFQSNLDAKADKNSPIFTGTPVLPTGTTGVTQNNTDNSTKLATTAFVQNAIAAGVIDATTTDKGKIKLAGDLGGTADAPTVPGLATKAPLASPTFTGTPTAPTATAGTNSTQIATTAFVAAAMTNASVVDADANTKGKLKLTGDLGGTADSPTVPGLANKENTITAGTTAQYFRGDKTWQTLDKASVGLSNVENTSDANKPVSAATLAALDLKAPLASAALTGVPTAPTATAGTNTTQIATTAFVSNAITSASVADATTSATGKIQLAGDLGGTGTTAAAPIISDNAITAAKIASSAITNIKIADGSITTTKIADANVTNAKIGETISIAKGGTGATTKAGAFDALSPMTTAGDLIYGGTNGTGTRLGKGTDGQVLTLASGVPSWTTPASSGVTTVGSVSGSSTANGASISGSTLSLAPADGTNPGIVTTGTQTFAGTKTFSNELFVNTLKIGQGGGSKDNNVAIGPNSLIDNTTGDFNVAIGTQNMSRNTSGSKNISIGSFNMKNNLTGRENVSVGFEAMQLNDNGSFNTVVGNGNLYSNISGSYNTAVGNNNASNLSSGQANVILGSGNGSQLTNGSNNVIIGNNVNTGNVDNHIFLANGQGTVRALHDGTSWTLGTIGSGTWNASTIGIGYGGTGATTKADAFDALSPMTTAGDIIYGGTNGTGTRLGKGTDGQVLTLASGVPSWTTPASSGVTTVGSVSGSSTANGASISGSTLSLAPADGTNPGIVTTGAQTFAGAKTFNNSIYLNTTSDGSTNRLKIGTGGRAWPATSGTSQNSLGLRIQSNSNDVIDFGVASLAGWIQVADVLNLGSYYNLHFNPNGGRVGVGFNSSLTRSELFQVNGSLYATEINSLVVKGNGTNVILGQGNVLGSLSTGSNNVGVGQYSLNYLTTGSENLAMSYSSMYRTSSGSYNISLGHNAMYNLISGNGNTAVGHTAGYTNTGSNNTFLGYQADGSAGLSNATAIGYGATVDADNKIQLGNTNVTLVATSGKLKTGTVTFPNTDGTSGQVLSTNGSGTISWTTPSAGGATTVGSVSGSSTANGASISGSTLSLAPADGTNPGIVTTGTQTFEGDKTFKSSIIGNTTLKVGSGLTTPGALDGFTSGSTTYPSPVTGIYGPMASASESTLLRLKLPINYGSSIQSLADFVMSGGNKSKLTIKLGNQNDDNFVNALTLMNAASGNNPLVGINNTSPSSTLDVTGTAAVSGNTSIGGNMNVTGEITNDALTASKGIFTDANKKLTSTGTLGLDQGGLGVSSITAGQVVFGNTSSAIGTSGNLKFDNTNSILKVGPGLTLGGAESGFYNGGGDYPTTPILGVYGPAATTSESTLLRLKRGHNQGTSYQAVADFIMEGGNKSKLSIRLGNENDNNFINALTMVGAPASDVPYIGINKTNPTKTLDISGTVGISGATSIGGDLTISSGSPGAGKVLTSDANGLATWTTPSAGGVTTVGSVSGSSTANGASISGNTLSLAPADGTNPGIVTTGTQTFAGAKTFSSAVKVGAVTYPNTDGSAGQLLSTDGSGTITWTSPTTVTEKSDEFTATADQQTFTLSHPKGTNRTIKMYINGIRISNTAYSDSGTTITYTKANNGNYTLVAGDRVQFDYSY